MVSLLAPVREGDSDREVSHGDVRVERYILRDPIETWVWRVITRECPCIHRTPRLGCIFVVLSTAERRTGRRGPGRSAEAIDAVHKRVIQRPRKWSAVVGLLDS